MRLPRWDSTFRKYPSLCLTLKDVVKPIQAWQNLNHGKRPLKKHIDQYFALSKHLKNCIYSFFFHSYFADRVCVQDMRLVAQTWHVLQGALLNGGINNKASGAAAGRCEKWSNLLLSWNQWDTLRSWVLPLQHFCPSCWLSCTLSARSPLLYLSDHSKGTTGNRALCMKAVIWPFFLWFVGLLPNFSFFCFDIICFVILQQTVFRWMWPENRLNISNKYSSYNRKISLVFTWKTILDHLEKSSL